MKILMLGENGINRKNWGHQLFLNSFSKIHNVTYWGIKHPRFNPKLSIPEVIKQYGRPDIILTYMAKRCYPFRSLADIKDIPKVHIEVDFFKKGDNKYKGQYNAESGYNKFADFFSNNKFALIFARGTPGMEGLKAAGITSDPLFLPFSVSTDHYFNRGIKRSIDVMAVFSTAQEAYPFRAKIHKVLMEDGKRNGYKVTIREVVQTMYINNLNSSKMFVTSNNRWGSLSMKYYEVMACGTLLLADKPIDLNRVGFIDNKHLVIYGGISDLLNKIKYYLKNENERIRIATEGMTFVRNNHTNLTRVKQFTNIVCDRLGIKK